MQADVVDVALDVIVPDGEHQQVDELVSRLAHLLREVDTVARLKRVDPAVHGLTKGGAEALTWGQLALTLFASGGAVVTLIGAIKDWAVRQPVPVSVKVKIGDDVLELSGVSQETAERLAASFSSVRLNK